MKTTRIYLFLIALSLFLGACQPSKKSETTALNLSNSIKYAQGLSIQKGKGYSVVKISNPWPNAKETFTYILKEKNAIIPESLRKFTQIQVPVQTIVVTSTTHIPSLEMLGVEKTLAGFPQLDYISSTKVRALIDAHKIKELGTNQNLNTEALLDLQPDLIVGYGIDGVHPSLDILQKSGLKVMFNGDWNETTPLGKAEWIKFFGALYGKEKLAEQIFSTIEKSYLETLKKVQKTKIRPTVLAGALYENQWYLPHGNSWGSLFIKDAGAHYLWADSKGTGSLSLSFETVLEKAVHADFWIGPSQYTSLAEMQKDQPHYAEFKAFKNKQVYSYSNKKGATGGLIFYEWAPNRPDWVLQDMVKIFHPELMPNYEFHFFEQLK
ncbi:MAG: ABC transporter substrate-binding protein [Bacteroidetes bacterium]|nr:ABC transporter substrate-binding protein [Bacteroidota bacterium]